jgi:hypothetical protein
VTIELTKEARVIGACMSGKFILGFIVFSVGTMSVIIITIISQMLWKLIVCVPLLTPSEYWMANISRRGGKLILNWEEEDGVIYGRFCDYSIMVYG